MHLNWCASLYICELHIPFVCIDIEVYVQDALNAVKNEAEI